MEYLSDGIADSIISSLSQIVDLKVSSSTSVRRYKGKQIDPQIVAAELGVRAVLVGRLLQPGETLSIRVELVDTQDNTQLWGEQYSRQPDEILALQEDIAQEISDKLRLQLSGEEQAQLAEQGTTNPEAYQAYLRGQHHFGRRNDSEDNRERELEKAIEYFEQAIEEDSTYANAYAGLSDTYSMQAAYAIRTTQEVHPMAIAAAQKALDLDPTLAEAHNVMGAIKRQNWDWNGAEAEFKQALELNPNSVRTLRSYANSLRAQRRFDESIVEIRKAHALDPLSSDLSAQIGWGLLYNKEYDAAAEQFQKTLELDPGYPSAMGGLTQVYWWTGEHEKAIAQVEQIGTPDSLQNAAFFRHLLSGNRAEAARTIENWPSPLQSHWKAGRYVMLGDKDRALELLENALDDGYASVMWANAYLQFDPLRSDPRFQDLLKRMNLMEP